MPELVIKKITCLVGFGRETLHPLQSSFNKRFESGRSTKRSSYARQYQYHFQSKELSKSIKWCEIRSYPPKKANQIFYTRKQTRLNTS